MTWMVALMLPLPILVAVDPATSADLACLYLGLACAWLATQIYGSRDVPESRGEWAAKIVAICLAVATNVVVFTCFGIAAGVQTQFPFWLMAPLSAMPSVGLIPWLMRRVGQPYPAIVLGGMLVLGAKLAACVVARIVYGSDYIERGYVSADWRTAKLMISLFWALSTTMSLGLLLAAYFGAKRASGSGRVTAVALDVSR
jgi:hypothetical protein